MRGLHLICPGAISLALCAAVSQVALAESPSLSQARKAYEDLEYDKVTPLLQEALAEAESPEEEVEIFELLATMHVTYNRDAKAQQAFVDLLRRREDYAPSANSSPKIRQVFEAARAEFEEERAALAEPEVTEDPTPAEVTPEEPAEEPAPDQQPQEVTSTAAPTPSPQEDELSLERSTPIQETWWFWAGAGTLGAAAVLGGGSYLIWTLTQPVVPETDFGPYQLK